MRKFVEKSTLVAIVFAAAVAVPQERGENDDPSVIELESDSFKLIRPTNVMSYQGFRINAGEWQLQADEARALATQLDFEASEWHFEGNVRIGIGTARISARSASFVFENQLLISGDMRGDPVVFEETAPDREGPVLGRAERLHYDSDAGTMQFVGKVSLSVGPYDTTGCDLVYFLREEDFTSGSSECEEPFTMIFSPSEAEESEGNASSTP